MQYALRARCTEAHKSAARVPTRPPAARTYFGNQAVLRQLTATAPSLQAKLAISPASDPLEQEADSAAEQVMMSGPQAPVAATLPSLQRKCAECAEEDAARLQAKRATSGNDIAIAPPIVHDVLRAPGEKLDDATRAFMERRFGQDFGEVRVHLDAKAADSARRVNATAYTVGRDVVFDAGRYAPRTDQGARLLAHELAHVAQQRGAAPRVARQPARDVASNAEEPGARQAETGFDGRSGAAQPMAGVPEDCIPQCKKHFKDCRDHGGDGSTCMAGLSACLRGCEDRPAGEPAQPPSPAKPSGPKAKSGPYQLSDKGKAFIKSPLIEGYCPNLYDDDTRNCGRNPQGNGNCTIYFGQLVHRGPCKPDEMPPRDRTQEAFADAVKIVNDLVTVELSDNQVDALVSFTFNANVGGMKELAPTLNAGDLAAMPDLIRKTITNNGLLARRRNREANLFANGDYHPKN